MTSSIPTVVRQHLQANDSLQEPIAFEEIASLLGADEPIAAGSSTIQIASRGIWVAVATAVITLLLLGLVPLLSGTQVPSPADTSPTPTTPTTTPSTEAPTATSTPVAPPGGAEDSTEEQPSEQGAQPAPVGDEGFDVIAEFIDAWKARDAAGMGQLSSSDLLDSDIQWLINLGTPAGEPYECAQWEDDDGPVAQCYIEIPDHGQYEQETHYILARRHADGPWEVTWAAALTQ